MSASAAGTGTSINLEFGPECALFRTMAYASDAMFSEYEPQEVPCTGLMSAGSLRLAGGGACS